MKVLISDNLHEAGVAVLESQPNIEVMNPPGGNTITTAEHALSLMMALARNIPQAAQSMREGKWEKKKFQGTELFNKTLGVIGMGRIGSIVADRALGLKMRVLAYDPFITKEVAENLGGRSEAHTSEL